MDDVWFYKMCEWDNIQNNSSEIFAKLLQERIEKAHQRLVDEGIEVTAIQKGVKEKTLVATVKSHTQNVPTLLIQHLD